MLTSDKAIILVPKKTSPNSLVKNIASGSGVVAQHLPDSSVPRIYFEGNLYGASNLHQIHERIQCAAGRLFMRYPTIAWFALDEAQIAENFIVAGTIDEHYRIEVSDAAALQGWANEYKAQR